MKKEITIPDLIKWLDKRIADEKEKRELPNDQSDYIQLGGKIAGLKEVRHLLQEKWINV